MGGNARQSDAVVGTAAQVAYTVPDAARLMGIGERSLWRMIANGEIQSIKIRRSRRVPRTAIDEYLNAQAAVA
jgi:excisionase family DNA binding protein